MPKFEVISFSTDLNFVESSFVKKKMFFREITHAYNYTAIIFNLMFCLFIVSWWGYIYIYIIFMNLKLSLSHTFITLIMNIPLIRYSKIYFYIHVYINTLTTYSGYFNLMHYKFGNKNPVIRKFIKYIIIYLWSLLIC